MKVSKGINVIRGNIMRRLTNSIIKSRANFNPDLLRPNDVKRVLISRPNHRLGNLILITPLIQEVSSTFPNCKVDLFVKGTVAPHIFKNYDCVDHIFQLPKKPFNHLLRYISCWFSIRRQRYDMTINVVEDSSSGRLSTRFSNSKHKIYGIDAEDKAKQTANDIEHIAKHPIYSLRNYLSKFGYDVNEKPIPVLDLKLTQAEIEKGKTVLENLVGLDKKTISIFTFATGYKCYSEDWWAVFYNRLLVEYPDYNILEILPAENVSQIGFKEITFYSHDIHEIASVISNTCAFIGADSGIMHLASAALTPTAGLFSITDPEKYRPYGNGSVALQTDNESMDHWFQSIATIL